jgi:hypothetical protein
VWGEAFENVILEGLTAAPLIQRYQIDSDPMVVGINMYKRIPDIIHKALSDEGSPQVGVGIDFSKFDSSIQPWLIDEAFKIIKDNIIFNNFYEERAFDYSWKHFIERPVVMPDGRMWLKRVGIPSGSYFTQLVGSICNHIAISYAQLVIYKRVFKTWVLGDDSLFGIPVELGLPDLDRFAKVLATLGLTMHPEKAVVASRPQDLEFLGHCARGTSVCRETAEMLRLALYPEYPVTSPAVSFSRIKGLFIDSGLTNWSMYNLFRYATIKFRSEREPELDSFGPDDANWLTAVANLRVAPKDIDVIKAWTIT